VRGNACWCEWISTCRPNRGGKIRISDDTRIRELCPRSTICESTARNDFDVALWPPKGKPVEKYSLPQSGLFAPADSSTSHFYHDTIGEVPEKIIELCRTATCTLGERQFHPGEEANDPNFCQSGRQSRAICMSTMLLAPPIAPRSTVGINKFVSQSAMGFLMKELTTHA